VVKEPFRSVEEASPESDDFQFVVVMFGEPVGI
jgi:hypothetical protein